MGSPCLHRPLPPQKSQIVIYSILLEFESQHFYMFINYNNFRIGVPFLATLPSKK